ncbi:MAG: hypothetical protein ACLR23_02660 [Clostridia bacterium]
MDELKAAGFSDVRMIPGGRRTQRRRNLLWRLYGWRKGLQTPRAPMAYCHALEQLPVQSGNPVSHGDECGMPPRCLGHYPSKEITGDIMYTLNTGWIILFAKNPQEVYDMNLCGLKIAEAVALPVIVAFDGFFTSHQERVAMIFENDEDVRSFVGETYIAPYHVLDPENPITIGAYMNEPDIMR